MSSPWIRRAAWALAALAALLLAAGAVFVASFDANRYKALAIDWMATERQRTLAIDGSIDLALWPRLALKVSGLHLSESGEQRGTEFAALDEASLSVRLWPLLRGQLVVDRIGLKGLRARLTRNADGVRNTDDLLTGKDTGKDSRPPGDEAGAGTSALRFDISAIELADLQLSLRDELAKLVGEIRLKSLTAGRLAQGVATPLSLQAELELRG